MSTIAFDCEWCGRGYEVPASQAGSMHYCKNCEGSTRVPDAAQGPDDAPTALQPPPFPQPERGGSPYEPGSPIRAMTGGDADAPTLLQPPPFPEPERRGSPFEPGSPFGTPAGADRGALASRAEPAAPAPKGIPAAWGDDDPDREVKQAANTALICALLGFVLCQLLAPVGLLLGLKARSLAQERDVTPPGTVWVAIILGGFGTVGLALFLFAMCLIGVLGQ